MLLCSGCFVINSFGRCASATVQQQCLQYKYKGIPMANLFGLFCSVGRCPSGMSLVYMSEQSGSLGYEVETVQVCSEYQCLKSVG